MEMIKIPHTDLEVSRLALGCMGLGGGWAADVQLTTDHERQAHEFLDAGRRLARISSTMPISMAVEGPRKFSGGS